MRLLIRNALVQYGADTILEGIDFEIRGNEKIAVVGRNGCGKTTLLKLISGQLSMNNPDSDEKAVFLLSGGQTIGYLEQINFEDKEISAEEEIKKVFHDVYACRDEMREIERKLSEDPEERLINRYAALQKQWDAMNGDSCEREMLVMFQKFGFSLEDLKKPMGTFSGGQQTKIAFIKLLLSKPDILLLDEPTNHLDLPSIEWLEDYLKKYEKAIVLVSHDRIFLDRIADVTYEIEYHRMTRYSGNYSAYLEQKEAALLKQEKDYEAQQKEIKRLTEWIEKWKNTPTKVSSARSKRMAIEHMVKIEKPRRFDRTTFRAHFSPRLESFQTVLSVRDLKIGYDRELSEVSFELRRAERLAIIGENGKGKSTLLKTLTGQVPALGGEFEYGGNVEVGYFDQQVAVINDMDPEQTVFDNFHDEYPRLTNEQVRSALGAFAFSQEEVERKLGQLSGGERVRLALCKMLFTRPNLLILDEPTNHLDIFGKDSLEQMLKEYSGTVLFVSHDRYFIRKIATQILDFEDTDVSFYPYPYETYLEEQKKKADRKKLLAGADSGQAGREGKGAGKAPDAFTEEDVSEEGIATAGKGTLWNTAAELEMIRKNPGKERARIERRIAKLEEELKESEQSLQDLNEAYHDPSAAADYEILGKLGEEIQKEEAKQEDLLALIMEQEEALSDLEELTGTSQA